ncbi:MAG: DNA-formamidopyrimidine glycosylase family protein [Anaerolineae bacterium]
MFELPEFVILSRQMNDTLKGKTVKLGQLGNSPGKFVWYNRSPEEFERLTCAKTVGSAWARGKWLFLPLQPHYRLVLGECGGKVLYHAPQSKLPQKYHLLIGFDDDSALSVTTQMWGAMELYEEGEEQKRQYIKDMRPTPSDAEFTLEYFCALLDELTQQKQRSVKALLTQEQLIPGLGNAIAQDILFRAQLHPKHAIAEMTQEQRRTLFEAIVNTVRCVIEQGGRNDEYNLYNERGGYVRQMDNNAVGQPCPRCGAAIEKMKYLGGACYFCPNCQH